MQVKKLVEESIVETTKEVNSTETERDQVLHNIGNIVAKDVPTDNNEVCKALLYFIMYYFKMYLAKTQILRTHFKIIFKSVMVLL